MIDTSGRHRPAMPTRMAAQHVAVLVAALAAVLAPGMAAAADTSDQASPWVFSVGAKTWLHEWTTWDISESVDAGGLRYDQITAAVAKPKATVIPVLGARYKRWLLSFSGMTSTHYTLQNTDTASLRRREMDSNIGYDLMPGMTLIVGYKASRQDLGLQDGSPSITFSGPTVAVNAAAPIGAGVAIYGTFGYGHMTARWRDGHSAAVHLPAQYSLGEWGLAYTQPVGGDERPLNLTFTLGYRAQTIRTRSVPLYATSADGSVTVQYAKVSASDFTHGVSLGMIASF